MKLLVIDNHDSFVCNIIGLLRECAGELAEEVTWTIVRNDITRPDLLHSCDALILSPGPGLPSEAGSLMETIRISLPDKPILGICLGCQAIAEYFGAGLRRLDKPRHGHPSVLKEIDTSDPLVGNLREGKSQIGRYHSWVIDETTLPPELAVTSRDADGLIMSIRHRQLPLFGTQFHPESIISSDGKKIMHNFLIKIVKSKSKSSQIC